MIRIAIAATGLALVGLAALAQTGVKTLNGVLTDARGMTLYTFDKDTGGKSACYDACATAWPPLLAEKGAKADGAYGLTERKDGTMQWTYEGMPLYLWAKDSQPGDMTGDGVKGVWHVAR